MQTFKVALKGRRLLDAPLLNKGTAFTESERRAFDLEGLLPPLVETLDAQVTRAYEAYQRKTDDLERHIYLRALQDNNETLFYRLLLDHVEEMLPIVYTPVVGEACKHYSHIYRRPRGLVVSYPLRNRIPQILRNRPAHEVDVIVVTDGERILGIGDQGVGGLGIPIGKLSLYTLIGGIAPERTLPIVLDVGTNNEEALGDPEYLGWKHARVTGEDYDDFIDRFVRAVSDEMPNTLVQWEDFANTHARPILERYRDRILTFNDDIQGTAAIVLGALTGAVKVAGGRLRDQRIAMYGAGAAGIGVVDHLCAAMIAEGLSEAEARSRFYIVNRKGLLNDRRTELLPEQRPYAHPAGRLAGWDLPVDGRRGLAEVVARAKPTILIGLSTVAGAFDEELVRSMADAVARPIIFPLSNPTDRSEASAADLIRWTDGRALVATGSPFPPVVYGGRTYPIAQCNNVYIFPAVGLGVIASRASRVTDGMMIAAARALGEASPALHNPEAALLPSIRELRANVAPDIAFAVGLEAQRARVAPETSVEELRANVMASHWTPAYAPFEPVAVL
jgi:malate dehydrogenase (oxaloacetate-decarboxylating)